MPLFWPSQLHQNCCTSEWPYCIFTILCPHANALLSSEISLIMQIANVKLCFFNNTLVLTQPWETSILCYPYMLELMCQEVLNVAYMSCERIFTLCTTKVLIINIVVVVVPATVAIACSSSRDCSCCKNFYLAVFTCQKTIIFSAYESTEMLLQKSQKLKIFWKNRKNWKNDYEKIFVNVLFLSCVSLFDWNFKVFCPWN